MTTTAMTATDTIRASLHTAMEFATALLRDMADEPLTRPHPDHGNHPYWVLGHLVVSEASLLDEHLLGRPNRHEKWMDRFDAGTTPGPDTGGGPTYRELFAALEAVRADTLAYLDELAPSDLGKPCFKADGPDPGFETVIDCLSAMSFHMAFHAGQVADARRAAGRKPLFM